MKPLYLEDLKEAIRRVGGWYWTPAPIPERAGGIPCPKALQLDEEAAAHLVTWIAEAVEEDEAALAALRREEESELDESDAIEEPEEDEED